MNYNISEVHMRDFWYKLYLSQNFSTKPEEWWKRRLNILQFQELL